MVDRLNTRLAAPSFTAVLLLIFFASAYANPQSTLKPAPNAADQRIAAPAPKPSEPELQAITSQIERGSYAQAESHARAFLQRQPASSAAHFTLGYVLYRENKPKESLTEYTTGSRYHTPAANDLAVVAMDYILLADYPDADKWLTQATHWQPENALYWYFLGRTKYSENRFQQAIAAFNRSLALKPDDLRAEYNLGLSFAGLGRFSEAEAAYKTAISLEKASGPSDPQPYLDLGSLLAQQGEIDQATSYLAKAVELDAGNPKAHEALGHNYEQLKELGKAASEYKEAVALAPNVSGLHFELGRVYRKEKRDDLAREEFARCAALNQAHSTESAETPNIDPQR